MVFSPSKYPSSNHPVFCSLHRARQLKRTVSTIGTFVWWPKTCLQLVLRPPPPLSGGHCCICFSTQKYRVSQKLTYRSVASSFQDSFFCKDFTIKSSNPWILQGGAALMIVGLAETGETLPKQLFWHGGSCDKKTGVQRAGLLLPSFWGLHLGTRSGQCTLFQYLE